MLDGGGGGGRGGGGPVMFIRFKEEAVEVSVVLLGGSLAGERSVRLGGSFLNILKSKNI